MKERRLVERFKGGEFVWSQSENFSSALVGEKAVTVQLEEEEFKSLINVM